jgi:hypothetical protein
MWLLSRWYSSYTVATGGPGPLLLCHSSNRPADVSKTHLYNSFFKIKKYNSLNLMTEHHRQHDCSTWGPYMHACPSLALATTVHLHLHLQLRPLHNGAPPPARAHRLPNHHLSYCLVMHTTSPTRLGRHPHARTRPTVYVQNNSTRFGF